MKVVSYSEARNNLKSVLDQVADDASENHYPPPRW